MGSVPVGVWKNLRQLRHPNDGSVFPDLLGSLGSKNPIFEILVACPSQDELKNYRGLSDYSYNSLRFLTQL